ncbi:hypothetical protein QQ045_005353 [Rhodiola kirilowii]
MTSAMQSLTVEQSHLLDWLGFGGMRRLQIKELLGDLSHWLVIDAERSCLKMKDYDIPINKMVVHRIFGLPCGGKPIRHPSRTHSTNLMVKKSRYEMGLEMGSVNPQEVAHDIVQNNVEERLDWFMMQFVILFCTTMVGAIKNGACNLTILHAFDSTLEIGELDWCEFVVNKLIESKKHWSKSNGGWFSGPLTFLAVRGGVSFASSLRRRKNDSMDQAGTRAVGTAAGKGTAPVRCSRRNKTAAAPDMQTAANGERVEEVGTQSPAVESPTCVLRSSLRKGTAPVMGSPRKKSVSETDAITTGGTGVETPEGGGRTEEVGRKLPPSWASNK